MNDMIAELDVPRLAKTFQRAAPFPHLALENFLQPAFAEQVQAALPSFDEAVEKGRLFSALNEVGKVQVTDRALLPPPLQRLEAALADEAFLRQLERITGIDNLLADRELAGGGLHMTGPGGRLDVHVDFNFIEERALHRRLNLLIYLNPQWEASWGGAVELWDEKVRRCHHAFAPLMNQAVLFETSERSFHGVQPVQCPDGVTRNSFAVYYYTKEPPAGYDGVKHSTVFRARPDERLRKYVLMPAQRLREKLRAARAKARQLRDGLRSLREEKKD